MFLRKGGIITNKTISGHKPFMYWVILSAAQDLMYAE